MPSRNLDPDKLAHNEDWEGDNIAISCPSCGKVFIVSDTRMHSDPDGNPGYRKCPNCGKSIGHVKGGRKSGGTASLEWPISS
jgi:predicted RNA-binding Zn-ribbon protein involved in translation (DUF1610 family)